MEKAHLHVAFPWGSVDRTCAPWFFEVLDYTFVVLLDILPHLAFPSLDCNRPYDRSNRPKKPAFFVSIFFSKYLAT
jgi:hypothetical protein